MSFRKLTQKEVLAEISKRTNNGVSQTDVKRVLAGLEDMLIENLKQWNEIPLSGTGKFYAREVSERKGRNPQTGEEIVIPAHIAIKFKSGKALKDAVNG